MTSGQDIFLQEFPVSRETIHSLSTYEKCLIEWSGKFNLVASSTLPYIWSRHFLDSAQLIGFIPDTAKTLADMGSGAGFPGLVLAIMAREKAKNLHVICIESTNKKADFLQAVVDELKLNVTIKRERVENIRDLKADVITARAMKALPDLLNYANYLTHKDSICVFPKGKSLGDELTAAKKYWTFAQQIHPSHSDESGNILVLSGLRYKTK